MKKLTIILIYLLICSCSNYQEKNKYKEMIKSIEIGDYKTAFSIFSKISKSSPYYQKALQKVEECKKLFEEKLHEQENKLNSIIANFEINKDDFKKITWYKHKHFSSKKYNETYLQTPVNNKGYIYLVSCYYGEDWLFHEKLLIKIGENVFESPRVPTYSENHHTEIGSSGV